MIKFKTTWHLFHLIMTFLTGGVWILIWLWRGLSNSQYNKNLASNLKLSHAKMQSQSLYNLEQKANHAAR